jgi:hypothetical protein
MLRDASCWWMSTDNLVEAYEVLHGSQKRP